MLKTRKFIKKISLLLVFIMFVTSTNSIVFAGVQLEAPYTGDTLVAVNSQDDFFNTSPTATTIGALPSINSDDNNNYSISEPVIEENIMGYDENGQGIIDPSSFLPQDEIIAPLSSEESQSVIDADISYAYSVGNTKQLTVKTSSGSINTSSTSENFEVLYVGDHCTVWAPTNTLLYPINSSDATTIGVEFDRVYDDMVNYFGDPIDTLYKYSDIDSDGKIAIVCYDIEKNGPATSSYISGYFYSGDLFSSINNNQMDMIHMDSVNGMGLTSGNTTNRTVSKCFGTLVHEFQHLIAFVNSPNTYKPTFLNEAFSEASTNLIYGPDNATSQGRVTTFNTNSYIKNGSVSLTDWESSLNNYALSYLLGMYLPTQYDKTNEVFKEIITRGASLPYTGNAQKDYEAYFNIVADVLGVESTSKLVENFYIALAEKDSEGPYAFKDSDWNIKPTAQYYTNTSSPSLAPGAAVYFGEHSNFTPSGNGEYIKFFSILPGFTISGVVETYTPYSSTTLTLYDSANKVVDTISFPLDWDPYTIDGPTLSSTTPFEFTELNSGTYRLEVSKLSHLTCEIKNISITNDDIWLTSHNNPEISTISLIPGDLNDDGIVNFSDIAIIRNSTSFNNKVHSNPLHVMFHYDFSVDSKDLINYDDMAVLLNSNHYLKKAESYSFN